MENNLSFDTTLMASLETKITVPKWNEAMDAYEQNRFKDAFLNLLDYVDVNIRKKYGNQDETYFKIPHGSIIVEIEIKDNLIKITAPFLKVGPTHKIPVFRRIAEINFSPLNLAQIKFKNDELYFQYETPLQLCQPFKMYYVLEEICHRADNYDDEFISAFDVEALHEPKVTHFSDETMEIIWQKFNDYLDEAFKYFEYFDHHRLNYFNWDIIVLTLKRMEYYMCPQGKLRTDIEREISNLTSQAPFNDRIQKGRQFLQSLKASSKEEILENFYIAETFIPIKFRAEIPAVKQNLQKSFDLAKTEIEKRDFIGATLSLLTNLYDMYYNAMVPKEVNEKAMKTLQHSASKPWETAAKILYDGTDAIINEKPLPFSVKSTEKKSFFSSLFK